VTQRSRFVFYLSSMLTVLIMVSASRASVGFQPVSPAELTMTSEPQAPGAPAIILYREVDRDDYGRTSHGGAIILGSQQSSDRFEDNYLRIKILTEAGRKFGNVEIPIPRQIGTIGTINARTIRPDGTIVNFDGKVFDKTIVKAKGFQYLARTFALSDVQVGSIIEYYYTITFNEGYIYSSNWILSDDLFTKKARFSLKPAQNDYLPLSFRWTEQLPPGTVSPKQGVDGIVRLEAENIAAFQWEDFMPPENEVKARVDFIYSHDPFEMDANKFWKKVGKRRNDELERLLGKRGAMSQVVSQIVSPGDAQDVKLQKIYARVQQLHNTSYEPRKTEEEQKRNKEGAAQTVEDVWKQGFGSAGQISSLYLALVRDAGFDAYAVAVPDRRYYFFNPQTMQSGRLDTHVVLVKLNGKDIFLDPGTAFAPFGMLPWEKTGVQGLRLDKDGGTWVQTPLPESSASRIERRADFTLSEDGSLQGKLTVVFIGLESLRRRLDERNEDQTARKKYLEDQVKQYIPVASEIELSNQPDWAASAPSLVAEFSVKVPGWASVSGRRALLPIGVFCNAENHVFEHSQRVHPVYFDYLSQKLDDVTIKLPPSWQVASVPKAQTQDLRVVGYAFTVDNNKSTLHLTRKLDINIGLVDTKFYLPLRSFFQNVRTGDEQQVVLQPVAAVSSN
jgi:hypothetical protein